MEGGEAERFGIHQLGLRTALAEIVFHGEVAHVITGTLKVLLPESRRRHGAAFFRFADYSQPYVQDKSPIPHRRQSRIRVVWRRTCQTGRKNPSGAKCF